MILAAFKLLRVFVANSRFARRVFVRFVLSASFHTASLRASTHLACSASFLSLCSFSFGLNKILPQLSRLCLREFTDSLEQFLTLEIAYKLGYFDEMRGIVLRTDNPVYIDVHG